MSTEPRDRDLTMVWLENDRISCMGDPRIVYDTVLDKSTKKPIWDFPKEILTKTDLNRLLLNDLNEYGKRMVIGKQGQLITASSNNEIDHHDMMPEVITGGFLSKPIQSDHARENGSIQIDNIDGSHSPKSLSIAITAFLLSGFTEKNQKIIANCYPSKEKTQITDLIDFIQKEFSPLEARIAYKLRLGEYPELIKAASDGLNKLPPEARKNVVSVFKVIADILCKSDLVITKNRELLTQHLEKSSNFKIPKIPVITQNEFKPSFWTAPPKSYASTSTAKQSGFGIKVKAYTSESEQTREVRSKL